MRAGTFRMNVVILVFLLHYSRSVYCHSWRQSALGTSPDNGENSQAAVPKHGEPFDTVNGHPALSENFFSGELQPGTRCYTARNFLDVMCGLSTELQRVKLATHITNCHLEAMGRPSIIWHDEHRLKYASEEDVAIVMQFLPFLRGICDRTQHSWSLALLESKIEGEESQENIVRQLRVETAKIEEAINKKLKILKELRDEQKLMQQNARTITKASKQLFNVSTSLHERQDKILENIKNNVNLSMKAAYEQSMANYHDLTVSVQQLQEKLNEMREKEETAGQSSNPFKFLESLFREHVTAKIYRLTQFMTVFVRGFGLSLTVRRTISLITFCATKISSIMKFLERYEYIGGRFIYIVSGMRTFLGIFSFLIVYKLVEAISSFLAAVYFFLLSVKDFIIRWSPNSMLFGYNRGGTTPVNRTSSADVNDEILRAILESPKIQALSNSSEDSLKFQSRRNSQSDLYCEKEETHRQVDAHDSLMASQVANLSHNISEVSETVAAIWDILQEITQAEQTSESKSEGERVEPELSVVDTGQAKIANNNVTRNIVRSGNESKIIPEERERLRMVKTPDSQRGKDGVMMKNCKRSGSRYNLRTRTPRPPKVDRNG